MKTEKFPPFLLYVWRDTGTKGFVAISLAIILLLCTIDYGFEGYATLHWGLGFLTVPWVVIWIKSWQAYKQYKSFTRDLKKPPLP